VVNLWLAVLLIKGTPFFLVAQLCLQLPALLSNTSSRKVSRTLQALPKACSKPATDQQTQDLKRIGALGPRAKTAASRLVSKHTVLRLLAALKAPTQVCLAVRMCVPAIRPVGASSTNPQPAGLQLPTVLPATLPECQWTQEQCSQRYGLTSSPAGTKALKRLGASLQSLQGWCTRLVQLDRPAEFKTALRAETWAKAHKGIIAFLGFCLHLTSTMYVGLHCYLEPSLLTSFTTFLVARHVAVGTIVFHLDLARRVVAYLTSQNAACLAVGQMGLLTTYCAWIQRLKSQVRANVRPIPANPSTSRAPADMADRGEWLAPEIMVARVVAAHTRAMAAIHAHLQQPLPRRPPTAEVAATVQAALMCCMCFGYLPPIRTSVLLSLVPYTYKGPCTNPNCQHPAMCSGNRVERTVLFDAARNPVGKTYSIFAPHHKNEARWGGAPIKIQLPTEMWPLVEFMVEGGHRALTRTAAAAEAPRTLFVHPSTMQPFQYSTFGTLFRDTLLQGTGADFPPQLCRSIFVAERRRADRAPGPADDAAAAVLGHSLRQWDNTYDREFKGRQAAAVPQAMKAWREQLLQRSAAATPRA
jgi:hypothetical protein